MKASPWSQVVGFGFGCLGVRVCGQEVFRRRSGGVQGGVQEVFGFQEVSRRFPGGFQEVSRRFPGGFQEVSRRFPGGFQEVSRKCSKAFSRF